MNSVKKNFIKILIVLLVSAGTLFIPFGSLGLEINALQQGVIALFVMAALMWILEPIPIWSTSVLVIALSLLCLSNKAFPIFKPDRFDDVAVNNIVDDVCGQANPGTVAELKKAIAERLTKKSKLNPEEVRLTLTQQTHEFAEKAMHGSQEAEALAQQYRDQAAGATDEAVRTSLEAQALKHHADATNLRSVQVQMNAAADKLYTAEIAARIKQVEVTNTMQQKSTMATFADPIIILFLGGFFLAAAATKFRLDINLAKVLLKPFGKDPKFVLLGLMCVTALFSMFMSNTATAAMMLAILSPVLSLFAPTDRGRAAFALCIPIAANIGGIGTPIGTPPNAIALKAMQDMGLNVTFGQWMCFGVPFVIVMILIAWVVLVKMFPIDQKEIELKMGGKFLKTPKAIIVYVTFAVTVFLWVIGDQIGLDSNTIAIVPIAVFAVTQVITKDDLRQMSWETLWLVAGGFALGLALQDTNLAQTLISAIPFGEWNSTMLLVGASFICLFMATFMSHTATASLLMPIMGAVAGSMMGAGSMDGAGAIGLLCTVAFASSLGMALPISTPPNALAYATGLVESKGMAISGTILCLIGLALSIALMVFLGAIGFFA